MKKISLLLLLSLLSTALIFTSCEKDEDDDNSINTTNTSANNTHLNPPSWLQGTWIDLSQTDIRTGYTFTSDDMLTIIGSSSVSVKDGLKSSDEISENISTSSYEFTITHTDTDNSTESWIFNKTDDTHATSTHGTVSVNLTKE